MQVDSNVSESDIGYVRAGQKATFRVDAFPDRDFEGSVTQVRQAPITVQNVVTYDVVVECRESRVAAEARHDGECERRHGVKGQRSARADRRAAFLRRRASRLRIPRQLDGAPGRQTRVWVLASRKVTPVTITTGLSDGTWVEVADGDLQAGRSRGNRRSPQRAGIARLGIGVAWRHWRSDDRDDAHAALARARSATLYEHRY